MTLTVPASGHNVVPPPANVPRTGTSALPYVDDIYLNTITFGPVTYSAGSGSFREVLRARVFSNRPAVNAEFGDYDDAADGDPNPFAAAGVPQILESTDPAIQDPAIRQGFNSLSLSQCIDGEGPDYSVDYLFKSGINDSSPGVLDGVPELAFFERGRNSDFTVRAIIGGTFDAPVFAPTTATVLRGQQWLAPNSFIDTVEIGSGQQLGAAGLDLDEFGDSSTFTVYGIRLSSINASGADMAGQLLTAANPSQFQPLPPGLGIDFGDLPNTYRTADASGGPAHGDGSREWLGTLWQGEGDGQPGDSALGDDFYGIDDEDGVVFVNGQFRVTMSVSNCQDSGRYGSDPSKMLYLAGFIDLNADGDFDDPGERVTRSENPLTWGAGVNSVTVPFSIPGTVHPGVIPIYSRWRLTYGVDVTIPTGYAEYGEVEDYLTTPEPASITLLGGALLLLARRRRRG